MSSDASLPSSAAPLDDATSTFDILSDSSSVLGRVQSRQTRESAASNGEARASAISPEAAVAVMREHLASVPASLSARGDVVNTEALAAAAARRTEALLAREAVPKVSQPANPAVVESSETLLERRHQHTPGMPLRGVYAIPKTGRPAVGQPSVVAGYPPAGLGAAAQKFPPNTFVGPPSATAGPQPGGPPPGLPSFLSSPSAYDAMYTAAMLRQEQHYRTLAAGNSRPATTAPRMVLATRAPRREELGKAAQKRPLEESTPAQSKEVAAAVKVEEHSRPKAAASPGGGSRKGPPAKAKTTPSPAGAAAGTPGSTAKRRRVNAKAKAAAGETVGPGRLFGPARDTGRSDANGVVLSNDKHPAVKTASKGVQAGTQQQEMKGEVPALPKPKNSVMTPPLQWQSSHQMPPHSLQDAFEVWAFCCYYSEPLLGIPAMLAGEYADALFARSLAPLMQKIHLALLRLVVPHVVTLSTREGCNESSRALRYLPLNASSTTLTLGWQCLAARTISALARDGGGEGRRTEEIDLAARWIESVEYKDIPPRVRITVLRALLDSCRVSPLFVRYQSCVSAALARAKVMMGRLAKIENDSMLRETEIGRGILTSGIEARRRELEQLETRLRMLNNWAKFGTPEAPAGESDSEKEEKPKEEEGDVSMAGAAAIGEDVPSMALAPLCPEGAYKELRMLSKRRAVVSAVRQQATRALLRLAPDEMAGQTSGAGVDRVFGELFSLVHGFSSLDRPAIPTLSFRKRPQQHHSEAEVDRLVESLDREPSRPEGKLRRHLVECRAKDVDLGELFPPDLRSVEGRACMASAGELRGIVRSLRREADRLLELTVKSTPIAAVSESYSALKGLVKPVELPHTLTVNGLLAAESFLGDSVKWSCPGEREAFLVTLGQEASGKGDDSTGSGWWDEYERGCSAGSVDGVVGPLSAAELKELGSKGERSPVMAVAPMIQWQAFGTPQGPKLERSASTGGSTTNSKGGQPHECKECGRVFKSQGGLTQHTNRGCKGAGHSGTPHSSDASSPQVEAYPSAPVGEGGPSPPKLAMCLGWLLDRVGEIN
ncbi:hypothetical protein FOZ62_028274 [Perkinsus olseni]|uniref:C2H2-type domain-containing protein n=1 Tax=Perkinsus olseni TaxID=32597 RepID=A0A7J6U6Y2_PEROL|nr:hypothetical protein FOZ62_028274 [Perkinsus olseni]